MTDPWKMLERYLEKIVNRVVMKTKFNETIDGSIKNII